jgi:hypothetical protein
MCKETANKEDALYLKYFRVSALKKMGFYIEAREEFHQILTQLEDTDTEFEQKLKAKVTIKLAKIYIALCNHFEAKTLLD